MIERATPAEQREAVTYVVSRWGVPTQTFVRREAAAIRDLGWSVSALSVKKPLRANGDSLLIGKRAGFVSAIRILSGFAQALRARPARTCEILRPLLNANPRNIPPMFLATVVGLAWSGNGLVTNRLHSHFGWVSGAAARAAARHADVPYTIVYHAFDIHTRVLRDRFAQVIAQEATQTFVIAERDIEFMREHFGVESRLLRMGVPRDWLAPEAVPSPPESAQLRAVTVASLTRKKGLDLLISAIAQSPRWSARIIGEGDQRGELEALIVELGVSSRVELVGLLDEEGVQRELRRADSFVLPSAVTDSGDRDGVPVAIMEAMANGKPVVACDVGAIGELVDGTVGALVAEASSTEIADALEMLEDPSRRRTLGEAGRQRIQDDWLVESQAQVLHEVFVGGSK